MVNIYIQGQLLDQYDDEVIEITSSVLDVSDLTKNTGDFSKTFTIPASPTNNKHFQHWYNASIDDGFDARTKVDGHIDIDGVPFKTGKWRLSEATFKDGMIDGYVINFFGNLPNIKDTLGDDLLSDINFVKHDHEWNGANVMEGLKGDLNSNTHTQREVVYTPMSNKRYFYNGNALTPVPDFDENNINIATAGSGSGIVWNDLRPSIKAKTIIDNIQHKYGAGTNQVVKINVTAQPTSTTSFSLTLNGLEDSVSLSPLSVTATATALRDFVNNSSVLNPHYLATVSGAIVTITSLEMEQEISPVTSISDDGLEIDMYVNAVGAFAYENPIVFSDDFFQTSEFEQMYLWLKRDDDEDVGINENIVQWSSGDFSDINPLTNTVTLTSVRSLSPTSSSYEKLTLSTSDIAGFGNTPFTIIKKTRVTDVDGNVTESVSEHVADVGNDGNVNEVTIPQTYRSNRIGTTVYEVQYFVRANTTFRVNVDLQRVAYTTTGTGGTPVQGATRLTFARPSAESKAYAVISDLMPKIKITDFLKGIFDMFKLVIVPQQDGSMLVNSLDSFYDQGNRYDISNKVDYSTFKVKRGELYQSIAYQFEDPSTILNEEFQNRARDKQSYGSSLVNVYESIRPIKLIDGEKVEIKLPFEQVVYERLTDLDTTASNEQLNISIGTIADKDMKPVTPKPILHYITEQDISGSRIKFIDEDNTETTLNTTMLMPMNQFGTLDAAYSLLFESEFSCWDGTVLDNNLYTLHHEDYIEAVFKLKRRSFEYEALLPTQLVTRLGLNDILTVEGIDYRINKFKHNLLEGTTKLDLINGFNTSLYSRTAKSYSTGFFIPSRINMSKYRSTLYFNVPRANSDYTIAKIDTGDGTTFLTVGVQSPADDNMMLIKCDTINTTGSSKSCEVKYENTVTGVITSITVTQLPNG